MDFHPCYICYTGKTGVSVPDAQSYGEAKRLVEELLEDVYEQFRSFRAGKGLAPPKVLGCCQGSYRAS